MAGSGRVLGQSYMNRPGVVTRFPALQKNGLIHCTTVSAVRLLAPSKSALIASQLVLPPHQFIGQGLLRHHATVFKQSPLWADQRRYRHDREHVLDLQSLCNTNFYGRSCCTFRCKAPVGYCTRVRSLLVKKYEEPCLVLYRRFLH